MLERGRLVRTRSGARYFDIAATAFSRFALSADGRRSRQSLPVLTFL